ncbi:MAG: AI-2E family transporter [Oligoflexia bacterium]|nr:AI-2E family transporter [Oligoflexia bacterium]
MSLMINPRREMTVVQQRILVAVALLFFISIYFLRSIYIPIFVSYFFAFLLNPVVRIAEKRGFGRLGPIFLLLILVFSAIMAFVLMMVPRVFVQVRELFEKLPLLMDFLSVRVGPVSEKYLGYDVFSQWKDVIPSIFPEIGNFPAAGILESVMSGTVKALSTLLTILLVPILTFYILKDYYLLNERLLQIVPRRYVEDVKEVMRRLSVVLGGLIRGQFLVCAILAAYYSIALGAIGMEMALLLGIFSGFMNLVPFVGPLVSLALSLFLALIGGAQLTQCIALVGVYLTANLLDNTVLTPKIVGKQMGISPLTIILALLAGGELLGFLGVLLALPIMAMVKVLGGYFTERYLSSAFYKEAPSTIDGKQSISDKI